MNTIVTPQIAGRYAPSPTGDLHLGNLRTALLSWLQVRLQGGRFLLRMEDLDTPRVVPGSADKILADLEWLGLDWDGEIVFQSQRHEYYQNALAQLEANDLVYPCFCSRKDIQSSVSAPHGKHVIYPQTCRHLSVQQRKQKYADKTPALRMKTEPTTINFVDGLHGSISEDLALECGDFVVKRADGLFAYQLAVVVDDAEQGITDVMRGQDLLDSTARQLYLFDKLQIGRAHV